MKYIRAYLALVYVVMFFAIAALELEPLIGVMNIISLG
jgi:hypothetical protein